MPLLAGLTDLFVLLTVEFQIAYRQLFLIDYQCTDCDDINLVLGSSYCCDEQTLVSDITSSLHVIPCKHISFLS